MLTKRIFRLFSWIAVFLSFVAPATAADLIGVRFGPEKGKTRVVIDLDGPSAYAISGDGKGAGRIFVDLESVAARQDRAFKAGKGHIARYGIADRGAGRSRIVLELGTTASLSDTFMLPPRDGNPKHRLVIDLASGSKAAFLNSLPAAYSDLEEIIRQTTVAESKRAAPQTETDGTPVPSAKPPNKPSIQEPIRGLAQKYIVVIDPGHGGRDPGAQGKSGTLEKNVTMAAANELKAILEKRGSYKVVLTRTSDSDRRIKKSQRDELARRESLARDAGADLFISLHADALKDSVVRGASVYTLSEKGSARSTTLAKSDGNYHVFNQDMDDFDEVVSDILLDKAQQAANTASSKLAKLLIDHISGKARLLNRSHRTADLRVLLAPDVPAVLLELAFLSNSKDEANLVSPVWRKVMMNAVADSIDAFFDIETDEHHAAYDRDNPRQR